jgi:hypothetical protein
MVPTRCRQLLVLPLLKLLLLAASTEAALNGAARTPPAGWRSWNFYACEIDAAVFERQIDALADRSRRVGGKPTSLADLGYNTVGIDGKLPPAAGPDSAVPAANTMLMVLTPPPLLRRLLAGLPLPRLAERLVSLRKYPPIHPVTHGAQQGTRT